MLVRDVMDRRFVECTEDTPLEKVFAEMNEHGADFAVVLEGRAHRIPIGVVTEHLICASIIARRREPRGLTAANVMTSGFDKVDCSTDISVVSIPSINAQMPVIIAVDDKGELCGALTRMRLLQLKMLENTKALMNSAATFAKPDAVTQWIQ